MTRRRILLVTPQLPWPLHQGTAIRNYHMARWLAARHDVTLLAFGDPAGRDGPSALATLRDLGLRVVTAPAPGRRPLWKRFVDLWTTATPDLARRLDADAMRRTLAGLIASLDGKRRPVELVQIEGLEMARHGLWAFDRLAGASRPAPTARSAPSADPVTRPRLVYDAHNAEWVLQQRAYEADRGRVRTWPGAGYSWVQTAKLRRFERQLLDRADVTIAVSTADADALCQVARPRELRVVPNGVDTAVIRPTDPALEDEDLAVFIGKMDFRPNIDAMVWFCREVWPLVRQQRPAARLAIVGKDPTPKVLALGEYLGAESSTKPDSAGEQGPSRQQLLPETAMEAPSGNGVVITGGVPDVAPYLERAAVVVVPLRVGGGTRLKVLEAMAAGKAIAATTLAVEGLEVVGGRDAVLADAPADLAAAVGDLLARPDRRRELGLAARRLVEAHYAWDTLLDTIADVYQSW